MITETSTALFGLMLMIACILLVDQVYIPVAVVSVLLAVGISWMIIRKKEK